MSNATGARFTVVVNHLKSKSSACDDVGDPDVGDGQGNCNQTRTKAAQALVRWLQTDPTGSGDPDFLLIGDMNSYAMEDPITAFKAGGLHDLVGELEGPAAYSYVFNGESGYLDHAIATSSLASQGAGVGHWHINPDEPTVLDYNTEFKTANQVNTFYAPTPYRSSDHDPVLIGLRPAVSVAQACALVESYVTKNKGLANSLCVKLQNGAYEAFRNEVSAQTGKALTAAQAATLLGAVDALAGS
jgi:predicted extracellular nuclease